MISVTYFGTHNFSAAILETLIKDGDFKIQTVITQPDRAVGRKKEMQKSPVKLLAEKYNLKIEQPETLKKYSITNKTDINIVCQYGMLIPNSILESAQDGSINVHTSLLPKYRGASPIQTALINGDQETGVTIMQMDEKMDHGPILSQEKIAITPNDTYFTLSDKMTSIAAPQLIQTVKNFINKKITPQAQNHDEATFCKELTRTDGEINWQKNATETYNLYRGLTPWPGIWTLWQNKRLKLLDIQPSIEKIKTGTIINNNGHLLAGCANNTAIEITKLQLEGKKPMNAKEFINGFIK